MNNTTDSRADGIGVAPELDSTEAYAAELVAKMQRAREIIKFAPEIGRRTIVASHLVANLRGHRYFELVEHTWPRGQRSWMPAPIGDGSCLQPVGEKWDDPDGGGSYESYGVFELVLEWDDPEHYSCALFVEYSDVEEAIELEAAAS